jgi:hypothetical protein
MQSEATKPVTAQSSWFFEALGEVSQFGGRLLRNFFKVGLTGAIFTAAITVAVYFGSSGGPAWRTPVLCFAAVFLCGILTIAMAGNLAVVFSLAETVRAKGLAKRVFDLLFAELAGVTDQNPQGDFEQTQKLHGIPMEELRSRLNEGGRHILTHPIATFLPAFIRWLARKAERLLVWATIKVVIAYASSQAGENRKVDLLALRANLAAIVDDLVTRRITVGAIRLALLMALIATAATWGMVEALIRLGPA